MNVFVKSKTEAKEVISLLEQLGYKRPSWAGSVDSYRRKINFVIISHGEIILCDKTSKEAMSIGQLRDLVVLKRNDKNDGDYRQEDGFNYFYTASDGAEYIYLNMPLEENNGKLVENVKPAIKDHMLQTKEWLDPNDNYSYHKCTVIAQGSGWIEIPKGAIKATLCNDYLIFWKDDFFSLSARDGDTGFTFEEDEDLGFVEYMGINDDTVVIWQRHTLPEELPFVDDEPKIKIGELYVDLKVNVDVDVSSSPFDTQIGGSHYKSLAIQPMRYALENKLDYAQSNVVKYVTRHASKGGKEDLLKAIHNIDLMIAHYYP